MRKRFYFICLMLAGLFSLMAHAQDNGQTFATPTGESPVNANGEPNWFINMDYAGFNFELPAGTVVQKGSSLIAKYPDGSFGVSMSNIAKPSRQKYAYEICRRNVEEMKLENASVEKVKYGKCAGAKASGTLEGSKVTILVLPYDDQEVTTVILASPNREEWVNHFLRTLKR